MPHTPGPWKNNHWDGCGLARVDAYGLQPLARVEARRDALGWIVKGGVDEAEANAHLIAAAPELMAALKDMVEIWERRIDGRSGPDDATNCLDSALAAIAKAEGRDS